MTLKRAASSLVLTLGLFSTGFAAAKPVSDDYLNDSVRTKLAADPVVKGGAIEVEVHDGAVVIKGKVEEEKQRARAEKIAKGVKGVKSVKNEIQIVHP